MRVRSARARVLAIVITVVVPAGAQVTPPAGSAAPGVNVAPELVPPVLVSSPEVAYPEGAQGDVIVRLVLTVARDGSVADVRAVEGDEPFRSAAETAARTWHFNPATRGGEPVAARIRLEGAFREPVPEPTQPDSQAGSSQPKRPTRGPSCMARATFGSSISALSPKRASPTARARRSSRGAIRTPRLFSRSSPRTSPSITATTRRGSPTTRRQTTDSRCSRSALTTFSLRP